MSAILVTVWVAGKRQELYLTPAKLKMGNFSKVWDRLSPEEKNKEVFNALGIKVEHQRIEFISLRAAWGRLTRDGKTITRRDWLGKKAVCSFKGRPVLVDYENDTVQYCSKAMLEQEDRGEWHEIDEAGALLCNFTYEEAKNQELLPE